MFEQNSSRVAIALLDSGNDGIREVSAKTIYVGSFFDQKTNRLFIASVNSGLQFVAIVADGLSI